MQFLGPKWPNSPNEDFFQETCSWALFLLFMHIYMPKIKVRYQTISKILMIKEYWNLIGWDPYLSLVWELDFSQACSFCRMLMNHKNFDFTQIPDKTNDMIFLKSPKTMFWGHFVLIGIFSKKSGCHTQLYMPPNIKLSFRKN